MASAIDAIERGRAIGLAVVQIAHVVLCVGQKTCRLQTKLVPSLTPAHECTIIPKEVCNLKFSSPRLEDKPLQSEWCLDPSDPVPDQTYDEENALGGVIGGGISPRTNP